ncbi:MAG: outer membrane beta-barrel protein [Prevotella sp.]|nr:outer membrane beta-barrel protein [Prevotella sp.]
MKNFLCTTLLAIISIAAFSQERKISGTLYDRDTKDPMVGTTVQLLKADKDSTYVTGVMAGDEGKFTITAPENGKFILKFTSVGYTAMFKNVTIAEDKDVALGDIIMGADAIMLKEAVATALAVKVIAKDDTLLYNSAAYKVPEGSVAEELVRLLPGAQVSDDGTVTVNGKQIKKIKVDGKEFMTGDTKTAMKNLPTSIIENIKVYDEKSDLSRITGIDDGNETATLDFGIKRGMNKGVMSNTDVGIGTHSRYSARTMGAYMKNDMRVMGFGSANNVNDMGFGGGRGGGFGRGRNGLNSSKMLGVNFNYDLKDPETRKDKLELNGSVRWNHSDSDARSKSSSENFVSTVGSFSNSLNQNYSRGDSWNAQMRLEWKPDTMTNIMFRPNISFSKNDSRSTSQSANYSSDPYEFTTDPLNQEAIDQMAADGLVVNSRRNSSISYNESKRFGGSLQLNRKLNSKGRNVTLRGEMNYNHSKSNNLSTNNVHLYQVTDRFGNDSTYQTNRYNLTPSKNYSYNVQATYSEPLWKNTFLQLSYQFNYSLSKSERDTYDFSNLGEDFFGGLTPRYRDWDSWLSRLEHPYEYYLDEKLSRYSEYKNYIHNIEVMFRMIREKYQFNVGVHVQPQMTKFIQDYQGIHTDTVRHVTNITPTLRYRYRFNKQSRLEINYRGNTSQPSMTDLLDITDDSNPLYITKGNPGLKPSFTNNFSLFYNNYWQKHFRFVQGSINYSTTRNSISRMVTYDEKTGGQTTRPENINGNWNIRTQMTYNQSIDTLGQWNISTFTTYNYDNSVGYVSLDRMSSSQKNYTRTSNIIERLALSFRPTFKTNWSLETELDGSVNYQHSRNKLQSQSDLDVWSFSYGGRIIASAPWGMSLATDMHMNSRRGYNEKSMNTNELIWNAQLSQSFLKGRPLTVSLQLYDILHQQSNFSRTINAYSRNDTEYNSINSYAMLHVIFRFNAFGGKNARRGMGDRPPGEDGPGGRGRFGGPGGPPPGGFGGGRPPGGPGGF